MVKHLSNNKNSILYHSGKSFFYSGDRDLGTGIVFFFCLLTRGDERMRERVFVCVLGDERMGG